MPHLTIGDEPVPFLVNTATGDAGPRIDLAGELDIATTPRLLDAAAALAPRGELTTADRVDLDLSAVSFVDAAGLDGLVGAQEVLRVGGWRLRVVGVRPFALVLLEITGLLSLLDVQQPAVGSLVAQRGSGSGRQDGVVRPR